MLALSVYLHQSKSLLRLLSLSIRTKAKTRYTCSLYPPHPRTKAYYTYSNP